MKVESLILDFIKPGTGSRATAMMLHNGETFYILNCTSGAKRFGKNAIVRGRMDATLYLQRIIARAKGRGLTSISLVRDTTEISDGQILAVTKALIDGYDTSVVESMERALKGAGEREIVPIKDFDFYKPSKAAEELEKFEESMVRVPTPELSPTIVKAPEKVTAPMVKNRFTDTPVKAVESPSELDKKRDEAGFGSW